MKALILAAGLGTRMAPITENIPKPLIPVLNRYVIEYNINFLKYYGVKEIFINLYHNGDKIIDALGNGKKYGVKIKYLKEKEILGTGGSIGTMRSYVSEPFIVLNSDTIFDFNLEEMIDSHQSSGAQVTLGVIHSDPRDSRAVVTVSESGRVTRMIDTAITEKVPEGNAIFTGLHIINPSLLEYIPENIFLSITSYVYRRMIEEKENINAVFINGKWWDMGTPDDYLKCTFELLKSLPLSYYDPFEKYPLKPDGLSGEGVVVLGKNVKIPTVPLNPPLVLGDSADLETVKVAGPNLVVGDKVKLTEASEAANAVYLKGADGEKVLFGKNGKIFY
jgi:mannose-1-phosphate guanylyltransferase